MKVSETAELPLGMIGPKCWSIETNEYAEADDAARYLHPQQFRGHELLLVSG